MSLPQFDPEIKLDSFMSEGITRIADTFTATGQLQGEETPEEKSEELIVLVSIWQTAEDTTAGGSAASIAARALGVGHRVGNHPGRWSATMYIRSGRFEAGRPATGLGHVVANGGDPTGFDTYTWTTRLQIQSAP